MYYGNTRRQDCGLAWLPGCLFSGDETRPTGKVCHLDRCPSRAGQRLACWLTVRPIFPPMTRLLGAGSIIFGSAEKRIVISEKERHAVRNFVRLHQLPRFGHSFPLLPARLLTCSPIPTSAGERTWFSDLPDRYGEPKGRGFAARRGHHPERLERFIAGTSAAKSRKGLL